MAKAGLIQAHKEVVEKELTLADQSGDGCDQSRALPAEDGFQGRKMGSRNPFLNPRIA